MTVRYLIKLGPDNNDTLLVTCPDPVHKATIIPRGRAGTPERQSARAIRGRMDLRPSPGPIIQVRGRRQCE
jgi:hypothetical protein